MVQIEWILFFFFKLGTQSDVKEELKAEKLPMPEAVAQVLYGSERPRWLREVVTAYREVTISMQNVTKALKEAATENSCFTNALLMVVMVSKNNCV